MPGMKRIEFSNPMHEKGYLRFITVKSKYLKRRGDICVFIPPDVNSLKSYPVVILLHGVYGSAWCLPYKIGIHRQAWQMIQRKELPPMIIVMPSDGLWGDGSG